MRERRRRGPLRRLRGGARLVLALALALGPAGAGACHRKADPIPAGGDAQLPPVEAPGDLIAEGTIATPDVTLQRVQRGIGGGASLLPGTLGGLVCAALGLDARLGPEVSGTSPAYLVVAGDPAAPSWVLAARFVELRRALPLFEGANAVFGVRDGGAGIGVLTSTGQSPARAPANVAGVAAGGWLVVGSSADALQELAPYATRTLPTKPVPKESIGLDVSRAALAGSVAATLEREWDKTRGAMLEDDQTLRVEHGGRAPDFGDPRAIVGALDTWMRRRVAAVRDFSGAHLAIEVGEEDVSAVLTASPASPAGAASAMLAGLRSGDSAPLARAPRNSTLAMLVRDDPAARAQDATEVEGALAATLGPRLGAADAKRVHTALEDWTEARGDWATLAVALTPTGGAAVADVASPDPARASRGVREGLELLSRVPAIHDPFASWLHMRDLTFSAPDGPGGAHASMAVVTRVGASPFGLAWAAGEADLKLALAAEPLPLLAPPLPGETLGDDPTLRPLLASMGDVAGAIVAQPGRSPGCTAAGGLVFAWGARADGAGAQVLRGQLASPYSSLRCLAKTLF